MRAVFVLVGLVLAFLVGGYVDHAYDWPYGMLGMTSSPPLPAGGTGSGSPAPLPTYSRAQGAQDPPRSDTAEGPRLDMQRCVDTMLQRRESEQEARQVCRKIITGITE